ncbi:MAG: hypothetical protein RL557_1088 [archaeon]
MGTREISLTYVQPFILYMSEDVMIAELERYKDIIQNAESSSMKKFAEDKVVLYESILEQKGLGALVC